MPEKATTPTVLLALLRDCVGATLWELGARIMTDEAKIDFLARLRGER